MEQTIREAARRTRLALGELLYIAATGDDPFKERTCSIVGEEYDDLLEYTSVEFSCGHYAIGLPQYFNYCPTCGRRVTEVVE